MINVYVYYAPVYNVQAKLYIHKHIILYICIMTNIICHMKLFIIFNLTFNQLSCVAIFRLPFASVVVVGRRDVSIEIAEQVVELRY